MQSFIAGQDLTIDVLFEQGLDTVVPDVGSVSYSLRDNSGDLIATDVDVTTTDTTTSVAVPLDASLNTKTASFEYRSLVVKWALKGGQMMTTVMYRITDFVPMSVNADSVRSLVGLARNELPDNDIDLYAAYVETKGDAGGTLVDTALSAGDTTTLMVNRAIAARALIDVLGSLEIRTMQQDKSNTTSMSRFTKVDFDSLRAWLQNLYDKALQAITGTDPAAFGSGMTLVTTLPTTDPVTGAAPVTPGSE